MSIVYLVAQAQIYECYKDTNRIECSFMFLLFGIINLVADYQVAIIINLGYGK